MVERVLLLGASGSMGYEAFKELWSRRFSDEELVYRITLLQRPSKKNRKLFKPYRAECDIKSHDTRVAEGNGFKIVWGDATSYDDILEAVNGIDWILSPMAFISPAADHNPTMSEAVNAKAIEDLIRAIYQVGGENHIKLVYIGSVAQTGDRLQEIHVGRIGDPLKPSIFDFYATHKIRGERAVIESGLKYWVSLRQTYIALPDATSLMDPIMFHQPLDTCIELNTARDAGRGLINCLDISEDSDFWRRVYNMGGGPSCRVVFLDYLAKMMSILGLGNYQDILERNWFALRNFHCHYFEDSSILNEYIHNWGESIDDHYQQVKSCCSIGIRAFAALSKIPGLRGLLKRLAYSRMKDMVQKKDGTLHWYESGNRQRISAFYGSFEAYEQIGDWDSDDFPRPSKWNRLDHGYNESKKKLDLKELNSAARFRGGKLISDSWSGNMYEKLRWSCGFEHEFNASPYLILKTGHWCPKCLAPPWRYDDEARMNPFFAQVWYSNHSEDEDNIYTKEDAVL